MNLRWIHPLIFRSISVFLLTLSLSEASGTHIVGGEVYYRYLGSDQYEITLKVYRDCYNGQAPFDNPASISIFDRTGQLVADNDVFITNQFQVPAVIINPCLIPPTNLCYEVAEYVFNRVLAPLGGDYTISYQRCCRNQTIINLNNVQGTGGTYTTTIPGPLKATGNSSPVFNSLPPTFLCQGDPFVFDHSASDADGDSLVYSLCTPLTGGSRQVPAPDPADPPPYTSVVFSPPYSLSNMLGGIPFTVDPITGIVTATPNSAGQFVYGVCVSEYRNGIRIGETRRDFQLNIVPCPSITVASIFSPNVLCGSLDAVFVNDSYGASTYRWDFGDPTTSADTSSLPQPVYSYPDTGAYDVRLIAYSSFNPNCNDTVFGRALVYPSFTAGFSVSNIRCSDEFGFSDGSFGGSRPTRWWHWDFGDGMNASLQTPVHTYSSPGDFEVTLIAAADSGCSDTVSTFINVLPIPQADFMLSIDSCSFKAMATDLSIRASDYQWTVDGIPIDDDPDPILEFNGSGLHTAALLVMSDSGCTDGKTISVQLPESPRAGLSWQVDPCDSTVRFTNLSAFASDYYWHFGDGDSSRTDSPSHTYTIAGQIPVELIAKSPFGCTDTLREDIFFVSYKEAAFDPYQDSCRFEMTFSGVSKNAVSYEWDFGDGTNSREPYPKHRFPSDGDYQVKLVLNGEYNCIDSIVKMVKYESPKGERVYIPNTFTPNGDGFNDRFRLSIYNPCFVYSISIFDRWGKKVYWMEDAADTDWDGMLDDGTIASGVYCWLLEGGPAPRQGIVLVAY